MKWEYKIIHMIVHDPEEEFDELGRAGWELVSVIAVAPYDNLRMNAYFKRQME